MMGAAEVLAQHQINQWAQHDGWWGCTCDGDVKFDAAHQLDVLKAAGYAVVELPKPDCEPITFDAATGLGIWEFGEGGRVCAWSDGYMIDENGNYLGEVDVVRAWAAALLAACAAVDSANAAEVSQ